ncbi:MAG: NirD/YgiW/YdeI family stress tolerance protein [Prolixibacteraceae bacterium]|nr:NirD/YgiW/YdeI family stress tolerance protein [Burkholderiales bacterium]
MNVKKTISLLAIAAVTASATLAQAQYTGPAAAPTTVKELLAQGKDDQYATLRGNLVKRIGGEKYLFSDGSGQITVEIDDKDFPAQQPVDAKTEVQLTGEFDKELIGSPEFDVDTVTLVK